jgi:hypothetical protein
MSAIAVCLNLLLISLLMLAVWIGFRLERRLKVLRGSQEGFVSAVAELNAGVDKAQAGLAELKSATLEARTELTDRLQDARGAAARIERQTAAAEEAARKLEALIERAQRSVPERLQTSAHPRPRARPEADPRINSGGDPGFFERARRFEEALVLRREALSQPPEKHLDPRLRGDERKVAGFDDDLFEARR